MDGLDMEKNLVINSICTASQIIDLRSVKNIIEELHEIARAKEIYVIFCNPINYEFVKQELENIHGDCNIVQSPYVEKNMIAVLPESSMKMRIPEFYECKNFFDED